jgi:hypothetical protein
MDKLTWLERLGVEQKELAERLAKLRVFRKSEGFRKLPDTDQVDLNIQYHGMCVYHETLIRRLTRHGGSITF